jgi:hypothetical protein
MMTLSLDAFRSGMQFQDPIDYDAPEFAGQSSRVPPPPAPSDVYPVRGAYKRQPLNQSHIDILMCELLMFLVAVQLYQRWNSTPSSQFTRSLDELQISCTTILETQSSRGNDNSSE